MGSERQARKLRRRNEKAVKRVFRGGKTSRDWKGSHTSKSRPKQKPKGCLSAIVLVGGTAAAVVATWKGLT